MPNRRSYIFHDQTTALCEKCLGTIPAKIISEGQNVYHLKRCPEHGQQKSLISTDMDYWKLSRDFRKPSDIPLHFQTETLRGCPHDCGLCPDHEQHSCLALIEVNDTCNLRCPVCFNDSSPDLKTHLPLPEIEKMLDTLVESEGTPDLLQISGGEPTLHPQLLDILHAAKKRPIRHIMLNTNGLRIAKDPDFVAALGDLKPGFEVYLQFDSLRRDPLMALRGVDLREVHERALANLDAAGISTTLVAVVKKGVNDDEIGDIIRHGIHHPCVRGVTFQPIQDAGRNLEFDKRQNRMVLSEIRRAVIDQSGIFGEADMVPVPCNPEVISIGYGLRNGGTVTAVTGIFPKEVMLQNAPNSVTFEGYPQIKDMMDNLLSLSSAGPQSTGVMQDILCCLPKVEAPETLGYDRMFRVAIVEFLDRFNFSLAGAKRSCIHFVVPDGRIIPFDTYNLFHREGLNV